MSVKIEIPTKDLVSAALRGGVFAAIYRLLDGSHLCICKVWGNDQLIARGYGSETRVIFRMSTQATWYGPKRILEVSTDAWLELVNGDNIDPEPIERCLSNVFTERFRFMPEHVVLKTREGMPRIIIHKNNTM